jgi:hypothetical protein
MPLQFLEVLIGGRLAFQTGNAIVIEYSMSKESSISGKAGGDQALRYNVAVCDFVALAITMDKSEMMYSIRVNHTDVWMIQQISVGDGSYTCWLQRRVRLGVRGLGERFGHIILRERKCL